MDDDHYNDEGEKMSMARTYPNIQLLDHGYIKLIETWGSDERIIEAARMSTDGAFRGWGPTDAACPTCGGAAAHAEINMSIVKGCLTCKGSGKMPGDEKLLAYLYNNNHSTPFEMAGAIIEVQAPIFVFREWHRHRVQSFNELSARYTPLPDLYYVPTTERCLLNSKTNKQAGRVADLKQEFVESFPARLEKEYATCESLYQEALANGVPKELARCIMPVGHYSRMRASANLRNWLGFLTLRQAPNAQWEIRQYADALNSILVERFPRTLELFNGHE